MSGEDKTSVKSEVDLQPIKQNIKDLVDGVPYEHQVHIIISYLNGLFVFGELPSKLPRYENLEQSKGSIKDLVDHTSDELRLDVIYGFIRGGWGLVQTQTI